MYRDEKSGELHGLSRVRAITIDDSHTFCTEAQIEQVAGELMDKANVIYEQLGLKLRFRLSFRDDSDAYLGDKDQWDKAQTIIETVAQQKQLDFFIAEGEAAFYGPKIDFIAEDSLGREWQLATVQLDFVQPKRFGLEYIDEDGSAKTPVMVHAALLGSAERFISVYIEHTAGHFPFWLAPEQVRVLSVNDEVKDYIGQITSLLSEVVSMQPLKYNELRFTLDERNESLGRKIREAETMKIPVILIVGPKDKEAGEVSVRSGGVESKVKLDGLKDYLSQL
jgi:threonyl-tRNA synthetase